MREDLLGIAVIGDPLPSLLQAELWNSSCLIPYDAFFGSLTVRVPEPSGLLRYAGGSVSTASGALPTPQVART